MLQSQQSFSMSSATAEKRSGLMRSNTNSMGASGKISSPMSMNVARAADGLSSSSEYMNSHNDGDSVYDQAQHADDFSESDMRNNRSHHDQYDNEQMIDMLCGFENGFSLLLDRIKLNMGSTKDALAFLRKRAVIEEEYGKSMLKLVQQTQMSKTDGKESSYGAAWTDFVGMHEKIGDYRLRFAEAISEVGEELSTLLRNTERSRKQLKEAGAKHAKTVMDAETAVEKAKSKYDASSEEWEKAILAREHKEYVDRHGMGAIGSPTYLHMGAGASAAQVATKSSGSSIGLFRKSNSQAGNKLMKNEDESRAKAASANESYKAQLQQTNIVRNAYFQSHLPRFIRLLKETNDDCDAGLQYHLVKYAHDYEDAYMKEAALLSPIEKEAIGIVRNADMINNERDFADYMSEYSIQAKSNRKADHTYMPYCASGEFRSSMPQGGQQFGVELVKLMERDGTAIPVTVVRCIALIEQFGLSSQGLYRVSGGGATIKKLRGQFNQDAEHVPLESAAGDVHALAGALKLFFRELPEPLFPRTLFRQLVDATRLDDQRMRLIAIHELVNNLPDAHYATLQALIGHLHRIALREHENRMNSCNLSIVWGPTLLETNERGSLSADGGDLRAQCKVVEVLIDNYDTIFDADDCTPDNADGQNINQDHLGDRDYCD